MVGWGGKGLQLILDGHAMHRAAWRRGGGDDMDRPMNLPATGRSLSRSPTEKRHTDGYLVRLYIDTDNERFRRQEASGTRNGSVIGNVRLERFLDFSLVSKNEENSRNLRRFVFKHFYRVKIPRIFVLNIYFAQLENYPPVQQSKYFL